MNTKPQRLFQFHLTTALLLTFIAAGFLWANLRHYPVKVAIGRGVYDWVYVDSLGWPFCFRQCDEHSIAILPTTTAWYAAPLIGNVAIALAGMAAAGLLFEFLIRRRYALKQCPSLPLDDRDNR